jgi:hypothetical protein
MRGYLLCLKKPVDQHSSSNALPTDSAEEPEYVRHIYCQSWDLSLDWKKMVDAYSVSMKREEVQQILKEIETLLGDQAGLPEPVEVAVNRLLNLVESLCKDIEGLKGEADRLRKLLEEKKRNKPGGAQGNTSKKNYSSDKRRSSDKPSPPLRNHHSRKELEVHETVNCPVDNSTLPADAVRHPDESVIVQNVVVAPHNIEFVREVYFSPSANKKFRGPLPEGCDQGDFGSDLRALIIALKYCGNMSEPKIGEFLENFNIEVSKGSLSNILTKTADRFEPVYNGIHEAGLASTRYQQTDDTGARVGGENWHTHILCNEFYTFYQTRPGKFRLDVLANLQNVPVVNFQIDDQTLELLDTHFKLPRKWGLALENQFQKHGSQTFDLKGLKVWFEDVLRLPKTWTNPHTSIAQAAAIRYYHTQQSVPVAEVLVCDDAPQFKLTTERIQLCWIHEGRHYEKLDPSVPQHKLVLTRFLDSFWDYYARLQSYRTEPTDEEAEQLRADFKQLFSTKTGYDDLDKRIAATGAKSELLTVLHYPECPMHNNTSELGARVSARRRDVSLHSRGAKGAHAMDVFTTIVQTCKKLGTSSYQFFRQFLTCEKSALDIPQTIRITANQQIPALC